MFWYRGVARSGGSFWACPPTTLHYTVLYYTTSVHCIDDGVRAHRQHYNTEYLLHYAALMTVGAPTATLHYIPYIALHYTILHNAPQHYLGDGGAPTVSTTLH
jgi:hypothetical protein